MSKIAVFTILPMAAFLAGALIPIQATSGAVLGRALGSPLWGAAVALLIGTIAILIVALMLRLPIPAISTALHGPWWMWIGGITGAIYVATSLAIISRIGAGSFIVCVIAGQMAAALLIDHFGLLGLDIKPITMGRAMGVSLMFVGLLIAQFSSAAPTPSKISAMNSATGTDHLLKPSQAPQSEVTKFI